MVSRVQVPLPLLPTESRSDDPSAGVVSSVSGGFANIRARPHRQRTIPPRVRGHRGHLLIPSLAVGVNVRARPARRSTCAEGCDGLAVVASGSVSANQPGNFSIRAGARGAVMEDASRASRCSRALSEFWRDHDHISPDEQVWVVIQTEGCKPAVEMQGGQAVQRHPHSGRDDCRSPSFSRSASQHSSALGGSGHSAATPKPDFSTMFETWQSRANFTPRSPPPTHLPTSRKRIAIRKKVGYSGSASSHCPASHNELPAPEGFFDPPVAKARTEDGADHGLGRATHDPFLAWSFSMRCCLDGHRRSDLWSVLLVDHRDLLGAPT